MRGDFGNNYFNNKKLEALISKYESMLKRGVNDYFDVEEIEQVVEYYLDVNQNGKALKAVNYAFQLHPNALHLMVKKAQIHLKNKNPHRALQSLQGVESIESSNTEIYLTKGHSHLLLGNLVESQDYYNQALSMVDDEGELLDILQNIAQTLQFSDLYEEAIRYLLQAYKLDKENLMVLYDLAFCYDRSDNPEKSIVYYNRYLKVEPYSEHIWYSLGKLYNDGGQIDKAIESYEMAVAINPEYTDAIYELAVLLEDNHQCEKAIKYYREYLLHEPGSAEIYLFIGNCYVQMDKFEQAIESYKKSLQIESNNPELYYVISNVLYQKENYWDALFYAKRATILDESDSRFQVLYGKINSRLKMYKESSKAFYKAVELKPELLHHWILLTDELISEKRYDKALKYLSDSMEFHSNSAIVLFRMAALYYKTDKLRRSVNYFKKAVALDKKRYEEFFIICPEAKRSKEIKEVLKNETI